MSVQNGIRRIVFGKKGTSQSYIDYLRQKGVWIGEGTTFFSPSSKLCGCAVSMDDRNWRECTDYSRRAHPYT